MATTSRLVVGRRVSHNPAVAASAETGQVNFHEKGTFDIPRPVGGIVKTPEITLAALLACGSRVAASMTSSRVPSGMYDPETGAVNLPPDFLLKCYTQVFQLAVERDARGAAFFHRSSHV